MRGLNKVTLIGRLTNSPETQVFPSGSRVTKTSLAINRTYTVDGEIIEDVEFVPIEAWNAIGDNIAKYMRKGSPIYIEGRLKTDRWEDKETGQMRYMTKVVATNVIFLPDPRDVRDDAPARPVARRTTPTPEPVDTPPEVFPDDIPF